MIQFPSNEIHLWQARCSGITDHSLLQQYQTLITEDEHKRQQRYKFENDRHRDLLARVLLRTTLSMYQDVTAKDWEFEVGDHGKPKIALPKSKLSFNLSHSHDYVILALGQEHDIGVDIEYMGRKSDYIAIAQHYFSASEIEDISTLPPDKQKERFYDYWTLKEAYIKACGMGLSLSLDKFSFSINQNGGADIQISENLDDNDDEWKFLRFAPEPDYRAAVAVRCGAGAQLIIRNFETIPLKGHCEVSSN